MSFKLPLDIAGPYCHKCIMAHLHKKIKKGRPYYYVRETGRVNGKTKVTKQVYIGTAEKILALAEHSWSEVAKIEVREYGSLLLAALIEQQVGFAAIADSIIPREGEQTTSAGEYLLHRVFQQMIEPGSSKPLVQWLKTMAIDFVRPSSITKAESAGVESAVGKITDEQVEKIMARFIEKVAEIAPPAPHCLLFDLPAYYSEATPAKPSGPGPSSGKLRQVNLTFLVDKQSGLPLYFRTAESDSSPPNLHDRDFDGLLHHVHTLRGEPGRITLVLDAKNRPEQLISKIDKDHRLNFIISKPLIESDFPLPNGQAVFKSLKWHDNQGCKQAVEPTRTQSAYRTLTIYQGGERCVVITHDSTGAAEQHLRFEKNMLHLLEFLYELQGKVEGQGAEYRRASSVRARYTETCARLHFPADLYYLELTTKNNKLFFTFRKNYHRINLHLARLGKTIIITDQLQWSTEEIIKASRSGAIMKQNFRPAGDPTSHSYPDKAHAHRCYLYSLVAHSYLRLIETKLHHAGIHLSGREAMDLMRSLHGCLTWMKGKRKPTLIAEEAIGPQKEILGVFDWEGRG